MKELSHLNVTDQYHQEGYLFIKLKLVNETATAHVAEALASLILADFYPYHFYFSGDLGTGKTAFIRYFLKKMGINTLIKSPTYTLIESYLVEHLDSEKKSAEMHFLHSDLYRINDPEELYDLGLLEEHSALWLIEWPEKGGDILPVPDINFEFSNDTERVHHLVIKIKITHALAPCLKEVF